MRREIEGCRREVVWWKGSTAVEGGRRGFQDNRGGKRVVEGVEGGRRAVKWEKTMRVKGGKSGVKGG